MKRLAVITFLLFGAVMQANATTIVYVDIEELARNSALIFRGKVRSVNVVEDKTKTKIQTVVTFDVKTVYKGVWTGPIFRLTLPGGKGSKYIMEIPGMPSFKVGEDVVLFLERTPTGFIPAGLSEGKFEVYKDKLGRTWVQRDMRGVAMFKRDLKSGKLIPTGPGKLEKFQLNQLINKINGAIKSEVME